MGFQSLAEYTCPAGLPAGSWIAAKEDVITTRFTVGANRWIALRMDVVPFMAGSRRSFWMSVMLKWKGDAVWITASKGGSEITAASKALGAAISGTIAKESWAVDVWLG